MRVCGRDSGAGYRYRRLLKTANRFLQDDSGMGDAPFSVNRSFAGPSLYPTTPPHRSRSGHVSFTPNTGDIHNSQHNLPITNIYTYMNTNLAQGPESTPSNQAPGEYCTLRQSGRHSDESSRFAGRPAQTEPRKSSKECQQTAE